MNRVLAACGFGVIVGLGWFLCDLWLELPTLTAFVLGSACAVSFYCGQDVQRKR